MSPQFPCAVERDLARYDEEMSERDRYQMAVAEEKARLVEEYSKPLDSECGYFFAAMVRVAAIRDCHHLRAMLDALGKGDDRAVITNLRAMMDAAIDRIAEQEAEEEVSNKMFYYDELRREAIEKAVRRLKERE